MKFKDIIEWSVRWSTPSWTMDEDAPVADGVVTYLSDGSTSIIGLAVECPDGRYFGSIKALGPVHDRVLEFLKQNQGRAYTPRNHGCRDRHLRRDSIDQWPSTSIRTCPKCNGYLGIRVFERRA